MFFDVRQSVFHAKSQRTKMLLPEIAMWLGGKDAGLYIGCSRDYVEQRALPWRDDYVPFKVRFKMLVGDPVGQPTRKYYRPDLDALLVVPKTPSRGTYRPRFRRIKSEKRGSVAEE